MIAYWDAFAASTVRWPDAGEFVLAPTVPGWPPPRLPVWRRYTAANPVVQLLINHSVNSLPHSLGSESDFVERHNCDFWADPTVGGGLPGNHLFAPSGPN